MNAGIDMHIWVVKAVIFEQKRRVYYSQSYSTACYSDEGETIWHL